MLHFQTFDIIKKKKKVTEGGICNPSIMNWLTLPAWARDKIIYNIPLTDKVALRTHTFNQLAEKEISFDSSQATPKCCPKWLIRAQPALACTAGHLVTSQSTRCLMALVPQQSNCIHSLALEKVNRPFPVCNEELNYQLLLCVCVRVAVMLHNCYCVSICQFQWALETELEDLSSFTHNFFLTIPNSWQGTFK